MTTGSTLRHVVGGGHGDRVPTAPSGPRAVQTPSPAFTRPSPCSIAVITVTDLIRRYNESVGGVNSDTEGYHETITQVFIRTLRLSLAWTEGQGLGAAQRGAQRARGAAGLAAQLLQPRASVLGRGAARLGRAGSGGVAGKSLMPLPIAAGKAAATLAA